MYVCVYIALFSPEPFSWAGAEEGEAPALGTVVSVGGVQQACERLLLTMSPDI